MPPCVTVRIYDIVPVNFELLIFVSNYLDLGVQPHSLDTALILPEEMIG